MSAVLPPSVEQEIEQTIVGIQGALLNNRVALSAICFLVYDILINLDREVEYIWKWSISKFLFIIGRYYGLCYIIANFVVNTTIGLSLKFCRAWFWYEVTAGDIFFTTLVNLILILRLYAMYRDRKALAFFILLLICELAFELYASITIGMETSRTAFTIPAGIPFPGCFASPNVKIALFAWIPCMIVATSFFIMTAAKVLAEGYPTPKRLRDIKKISPLIVLMVRDGALYYTVMFSILLVTILLIELSQGQTPALTIQWLIAFYSLAASRLVLNLREAGNQAYFGSTVGSRTTAPPVFAMGPIDRAGKGRGYYGYQRAPSPIGTSSETQTYV